MNRRINQGRLHSFRGGTWLLLGSLGCKAKSARPIFLQNRDDVMNSSGGDERGKEMNGCVVSLAFDDINGCDTRVDYPPDFACRPKPKSDNSWYVKSRHTLPLDFENVDIPTFKACVFHACRKMMPSNFFTIEKALDISSRSGPFSLPVSTIFAQLLHGASRSSYNLLGSLKREAG